MNAATLERRHNLGSLERVPMGEGKVFEVSGRRIAVFRLRTGEAYATQAECPHRQGPLASGLVGEGKVVCPLHGNAFQLADGRPVNNTCDALQTYQVTVDAEGQIWVKLSP